MHFAITQLSPVCPLLEFRALRPRQRKCRTRLWDGCRVRSVNCRLHLDLRDVNLLVHKRFVTRVPKSEGDECSAKCRNPGSIQNECRDCTIDKKNLERTKRFLRSQIERYRGVGRAMPELLQNALVTFSRQQYRALLEVAEAIAAHRDINELFQELGRQLLLEEIHPDTTQGEAPEVPRYEANREPGSTADVD